MELRVRATGQVMYESEFRQYLKDTNGPSYETLTPEIMAELSVDPVFEGPQAIPTNVYEFSQRQGVELKADGKWYTKYILGPIFVDIPAQDNRPAISANEQLIQHKLQVDKGKAHEVRNQRDLLLKQSDWTQCKDIGDIISIPWATYRQQLRDVPSQTGFPWTVQWPTKPE